jgi:hypothetical protein
MSESYLLECKCGKRTAVNPNQAGRTVRCACGAKLDVPALRAMRRLPVAEHADADAQQSWSGRQRLWTVGAVLILSAIGLAVYTRWIAPPPPNAAVKYALDLEAEKYRREVEDYTFAQTRDEFHKFNVDELRAYADKIATNPYYQIYRDKNNVTSAWTIIAWSLAGAGFLLIALGHVLSAAPREALRHAPSVKAPKSGMKSNSN